MLLDDVIKWKYWPFVGEIHPSPVNSPQKGQLREALMFSLICAWTNGWANNRDAVDLRHHRAHYDVTVINSGQFCHAIITKYLICPPIGIHVYACSRNRFHQPEMQRYWYVVRFIKPQDFTFRISLWCLGDQSPSGNGRSGSGCWHFKWIGSTFHMSGQNVLFTLVISVNVNKVYENSYSAHSKCWRLEPNSYEYVFNIYSFSTKRVMFYR